MNSIRWHRLCMSPAFITSLLVGISIPNYAVSEDSTAIKKDALDQIIVVANKVPRSIHQVAANVSVISKQNLNDTLSTSIRDTFQFAPGINAESAGQRFGTESVNIRGVGGNRVALVLDGVPFGDQFSVGNFSNATRDFINAGLIQRIEVLHGPASTLYGSDAIGGVVATFTPDPVDILQPTAPGIDPDSRFGGEILSSIHDGDNSAHIRTIAAAGNEDVGFLAAASIRDGEEQEPFNSSQNLDQREYRRKSVLLKLVANDYFNQSFRISYLRQESDTRSDLQSILGTGRFRSTTQLLGDDVATFDQLGMEWELPVLKDVIDSSTLRVYRQQSKFNQKTVDERKLARTPSVINRSFDYQQQTDGIELNFQKEIPGSGSESTHHIGFGLEYRNKKTTELRNGLLTEIDSGKDSNIILGETFPLRDFPLSATKESGAYVEYSRISSNWTAIAALRADHYKLTATPDTIYLEDNLGSPVVSLSESDVSPKLGLIYHLTDQSDVYLQYAHGFRAPPFEDANIGLDIPLFKIRAIPNPDLRSETSDGFDLGYRWVSSATSFHLGLFHTDYEDFIETKVRLGLDPQSDRILFQSRNLSAARIRGLEAGWKVALTDNFESTGALYIADGVNKETGNTLDSVGPEQLVLGISWLSESGRRSARLLGTFTNSVSTSSNDDSIPFEPRSYSVFDLFLSQKLADNMTLRIGLRNLSNEEYWDWSDVRGFEANDPSLSVLTRPGRRASLSLDYTW